MAFCTPRMASVPQHIRIPVYDSGIVEKSPVTLWEPELASNVEDLSMCAVSHSSCGNSSKSWHFPFSKTKKFPKKPRLKLIAGPVMTARIGTRWANLAAHPNLHPKPCKTVWKSEMGQVWRVAKHQQCQEVPELPGSSEGGSKDRQKPISEAIHRPSILALWCAQGDPLDLLPNRWIAHPRPAENARGVLGMYLDLVPNDKG